MNKLRQGITELKNNKTSGKNSIIAGLCKYVDSRIIDILTKITHDVWIIEEIPAEWTTPTGKQMMM